MRKILVVFEHNDQTRALSNLRIGLEMARAAGPEVALRVCLLEPADEDGLALEELAKATRQDLELARRVVVKENRPETPIEVLRGSTVELTWLVANLAEKWEADEILVSLGQPCAECKKVRLGHWLGILRPRSRTEPFLKPIVEAETLTRLFSGKVTFTCHGEAIMSVQTYYPRKEMSVSEPYISATQDFQ